MNKKIKFNRLFSVILSLVIMLSAIPMGVQAAVTTRQVSPPDVSRNIYQVRDGDELYVEPSNKLGNPLNGVMPRCYLITQDARRVDTQELNYGDDTYDIVDVFITDTIEDFAHIIGENVILFIESGVYRVSINSPYSSATLFSKSNLSIIGFGSSKVVFQRGSDNGGNPARIAFNAPNIYVKNITFDYSGLNTLSNTADGNYAVFVGGGAANFIIENCAITNVGNIVTSSLYKNIGLGVADVAAGNRHFINLTIDNVKSNVISSVVEINQASRVYFKNLNVDGSVAGAPDRAIRIGDPGLTFEERQSLSCVFAGNMKITSTNTAGVGFVGVQSVEYDIIALPKDYRYVEYYYFSGLRAGCDYRIWNILPGHSDESAVLDRADNYWIISFDNFHEECDNLVNTHLQCVSHVRKIIKNRINTRVPDVNVKIIAKSINGMIESFFVSNFDAGVTVNLVVVGSLGDLYNSRELIPIEAGGLVDLSANAYNVKLYNIDFAAEAKYTFQRAVYGIIADEFEVQDGNDGSYLLGMNVADYRPENDVPAAITDNGNGGPGGSEPNAGNISADSFVNCRFIALLKEIWVDDHRISMGDKVDLSPELTGGGGLPIPRISDIDSPDLHYWSDNSHVAVVDSDGVVMAVGRGRAIIYIKARDLYNTGEFEKPWAMSVITVRADYLKPDLSDKLEVENHIAYMLGYPDGTIRPENNITRGEAAMIFFRLLKGSYRDTLLTQTNSFVDVTSGLWYNEAVSTLAAGEYVFGYAGSNRFEGDRFITRAEFAIIAARFTDDIYLGDNVFPDLEDHWAAPDINLAVELGWITGYPDGTFRPNQPITRAEVSVFANRVLGRDMLNYSSFLPHMITWPDNEIGQWYYMDVQEATNSHDFYRKDDGTEVWTKILLGIRS